MHLPIRIDIIPTRFPTRTVGLVYEVCRSDAASTRRSMWQAFQALSVKRGISQQPACGRLPWFAWGVLYDTGVAGALQSGEPGKIEGPESARDCGYGPPRWVSASFEPSWCLWLLLIEPSGVWLAGQNTNSDRSPPMSYQQPVAS